MLILCCLADYRYERNASKAPYSLWNNLKHLKNNPLLKSALTSKLKDILIIFVCCLVLQKNILCVLLLIVVKMTRKSGSVHSRNKICLENKVFCVPKHDKNVLHYIILYYIILVNK